MVSKNKYHKHTILFRGFPFKLVKKYIFFYFLLYERLKRWYWEIPYLRVFNIKTEWYYYVQYTLRFGNCVKQNQIDAQFILSIFRQSLHVSGISTPIIRRYNRVYTRDSHLKRIISNNCCIHTVVPPDDGPR